MPSSALLIVSFALLAQSPARSTPAELFDRFGACVDAAGDIDGDGVPDLWIGDPSRRDWGDDAFGKAWCVSGKDGSTLLRIDAPDDARDFGWTVAGLGDVDGDGARDVAVGCQYLAGSARGGETPMGDSVVSIFSGRGGARIRAIAGPADRLKESWFSTAAGPTLVAVGDWNEDGADDLAIGWSYADGDAVDQGRVQVVSGKDGATLHAWLGLEEHDRFGFSLAKLADLDGDGRAELAAGAVPERSLAKDAPDKRRRTRSGYVSILSSKGAVVRTIHPFDGGPTFGFSVASFPPASAGGPSGLIVGQAHDWNSRYVVTRWNPSDGSLTQAISKPPLDAWDGGWNRKNVSPPADSVRESFATRVLAVPDRDGDGLADVLVTEPQAFCFVPAGVLSSKVGTGTAESTVGVPLGRVELVDARVEYSHVGISLCAPGDLDGDGVQDFVLSGASVRCGSDCTGTVVLVSGKSLKVLRWFTRAGRT